MSDRPRVADLFCGAAVGLWRAGFEPVGFDIEPQPRYPFEFHQADALTVPLDGFDAYWASPPCQGYSVMHNLPWLRDRVYPLLILPVLERLEATGKPYIIENVMGARHGAKGLTKRGIEAHGLKAGYLCGTMFGLPFYRHRLLAANWLWLAPGHPKHSLDLHYYHRGEDGQRRYYHMSLSATGASHKNWISTHAREQGLGNARGWRQAAANMGIDWMERRQELTQAIPPIYAEHAGRQMMALIRGGQDAD